MRKLTTQRARAISTSEFTDRSDSLRRGRFLRAALCCGLLAPAVWGAASLLGAERGLAPGLTLLWGAVSAAMLMALGHHPFARFGPANALTGLRAAGTVTLAGVAVAPEVFEDGMRWTALGLAGAILALDGLDGALARRTGLASAYGARFDMEVDAALTLVLSLIAWRTGAAGPAILALAAPYYVFRALTPPVPWLGGALPPSLLRKAVCVLQVATPLAILAAPWVPATALVWTALAALAWSFGRDIRHLGRQPR